MPTNLDLHNIVDRYIHKLTALHEVVPHQMAMASVLAHASIKKHKKFLLVKAEEIEETGESTSYKLNIKDVKRSSRLGRKSDQAKTVLDLLPRNFAVSYVSEYDSYLGQALTQILKFNPEIIDSKDKNISLSDLVSLGSIEAAREKIISKEVESVLRSSHSEQFAWMEKAFSVPLNKDLKSWPSFIELTERRNLFVHCDGIVSDQYLKACEKHGVNIEKDLCIGDRLKADRKYLRQSYETLYELGIKLSQVLWRKLSPKNLDEADASLSHFTYELLIEENYRLAIILLDFACCTLKKWSAESTRLIYIVNRALAYKFSGDNETCQRILNSHDWSACGENYNLCVSVLQDDFEKAKNIMLKIGKDGCVSEADYLEWPCFKIFRESKEFIEAFAEVFGKPPTAIEQIGDFDDEDELDDAIKELESEAKSDELDAVS